MSPSLCKILAPSITKESTRLCEPDATALVKTGPLITNGLKKAQKRPERNKKYLERCSTPMLPIFEKFPEQKLSTF